MSQNISLMIIIYPKLMSALLVHQGSTRLLSFIRIRLFPPLITYIAGSLFRTRQHCFRKKIQKIQD
jgi:hypothetical protein